jgi:DNA-binding beta-propeller fold protein YncE
LYCANTGGDGFYPESTVSVIDPSQNRVLKDIVVGPGPCLLSYNEIEGKIYVAGRDMVIRTIDVRTDSVVHGATLDSLPRSMVFGSSCNRLFVVTQWSNRCALWVVDGSGDSVVAAHHVVNALPCLSVALGWNPDAKKAYLFYSYALSDSVAVWDAEADTITKVIGRLPHYPISSAYDPTDSTVYAGTDGYRDGELAMIDGTDDSLLGTLHYDFCRGREALCFSPQTSRLYITGTGSEYAVVVAGRTHLGHVRVGKSPVLAHVGSNGIVYVANAGSGDITAFPDTLYVSIEDARSPAHPVNGLRATVISEKLLIPTPTLRSTVTYALVDVAGRRVTELHPGLNDVSGLAPGVYFLEERGVDCGRASASIRKIVVTR